MQLLWLEASLAVMMAVTFLLVFISILNILRSLGCLGVRLLDAKLCLHSTRHSTLLVSDVLDDASQSPIVHHSYHDDLSSINIEPSTEQAA